MRKREGEERRQRDKERDRGIQKVRRLMTGTFSFDRPFPKFFVWPYQCSPARYIVAIRMTSSATLTILAAAYVQECCMRRSPALLTVC